MRHQIAAIGLDTPTLVISEPRQALQMAQSMRHNDDVIILTGSTYMIEQVLNPDPVSAPHERELRLAHGRKDRPPAARLHWTCPTRRRW